MRIRNIIQIILIFIPLQQCACAAPQTTTVGQNNEQPQIIEWCPPIRSQEPHPCGRLRIATWNLSNLHRKNGESTYIGQSPSEIRETKDYERIKCYIRMTDPDILAVQEVDGEEALIRVVDKDIYNVHVSSRPKGSLNGKQNTGFAYKKGITIQEIDDFRSLDTSNGELRYGTQIIVTHNNKSFKMLSVHLKSGCFDNTLTGKPCSKLRQQIPEIENWIDQEASGPYPFIILGDFNRRFNIEGDTFWEEIDDGNPSNADLTNITKNKCISCRDNKYDTFIDHIVFDKRSWTWVDDSSFRHVTFRKADKPVWDKISDHCPIVVELWIK
jgi:endonuclease/exonuclease/phosphatase family metal-dependent hydrolase